jgi:hypothetical protein
MVVISQQYLPSCLLPQIITFGKVVRPIMGISFAPDQSGAAPNGQMALLAAAMRAT